MKPRNIRIICISIESLRTDARDTVENFIEAKELIRHCKISFDDTFFMGPEQMN